MTEDALKGKSKQVTFLSIISSETAFPCVYKRPQKQVSRFRLCWPPMRGEQRQNKVPVCTLIKLSGVLEAMDRKDSDANNKAGRVR